jgi:hypothetical protein
VKRDSSFADAKHRFQPGLQLLPQGRYDEFMRAEALLDQNRSGGLVGQSQDPVGQSTCRPLVQESLPAQQVSKPRHLDRSLYPCHQASIEANAMRPTG